MGLNNHHRRSIEPEVLEQILRNVFERTGRQPNTIPLNDLTAYSGYRRERFTLIRVGIAVLLLVFLLLPFLFFVGKIEVRERKDTLPNRKAFNITVDSIIPIERLTAEMNGKTLPLYEAAGKEYLLVPSVNGHADIELLLKNGQKTNMEIEVTGIDVKGPEAVRFEYDESSMYITLDDSSTIDYAKTKLTDADGNEYPILRCEEEKKRIAISYPEQTMDLYLYDIWGNETRIVLNTET